MESQSDSLKAGQDSGFIGSAAFLNTIEADIFKSLASNSDSAYIVLNRQRDIIWVNKKAFSLFNFSNVESGSKIAEFCINNGFTDYDALENAFLLAFVGEEVQLDLSCKNESETRFFKSKFYSVSPQLDYSVLQLNELTEEITALLVEQESRIKAEENDRLKTIFLANMSHEIRTPLNSILGFSDLMLENNTFDEETQEFVEMIKSAGDTLLQLINDIIDISKIEAGQVKTMITRVDVNAVLDEMYLTIENLKKAKGKDHVKIVIDRPSPDVSLILDTDPNRFRQIFTNLLTNALKFVDEGSIHFGFTEIKQDFVQFFVKDTGMGIERDKVHLIFQRFAKFDTSMGHNAEGTGLGLSITKQLVELLGGRIWFDSEFRKGSTFYFTLPNSSISSENSGSFRKAASFKLPDWAGKTFLVVDDVESNYLYYKSLMKNSGAVVLWAKDGAEAIQISKSNPSLSLVLMDLMMPAMDGFETTKQIKEMNPLLPIIAQTAFAYEKGKDDAKAAGCDDYITKPIQQSELVMLITNLLDKD
jgi:signal transduction histidine kinase/CheY-like chemotaxis protein